MDYISGFTYARGINIGRMQIRDLLPRQLSLETQLNIALHSYKFRIVSGRTLEKFGNFSKVCRFDQTFIGA